MAQLDISVLTKKDIIVKVGTFISVVSNHNDEDVDYYDYFLIEDEENEHY